MLIPGEPAAGQLQRGIAGSSAKAEFARERLAGTADREIGGEAAARSRRLLLYRSAIATSAPADSADGLPVHLDHVLDDVRDAVMPFDRRRRLLAASSCFYRERRGDDAADVR